MRILFNTYPVAFFYPGGGEIQLLKTKEGIEKKGIEVKLFNTWKPQLKKVDLVHYFSIMGDSVNFCSYVKKIGLPLVISPIIWLGRDKETYPLAGMKALFDLCDLILPNSVMELEKFSRFFKIPKEKFFVVRNGVDPSFSSRIPENLFREKFGIKNEFLLNVANIERRKNQLSLIRAIKKMGLDLILFGNIRDESYFNKCMSEGKGFIKYLGYINHDSDTLKSAYRACKLFVLPSLLETPGLAALEAAAAGAKIVITEIGSTKEYFGNMATYVDPYDINDIHKTILRALRNKKNQGLSKYIIENFNWEKTGEQTIEAYQLVLDKHKK